MIEPLYFPILRAKAGEIDAIGRLRTSTQARTRPMLDFPLYVGDDSDSLSMQYGQRILDAAKAWGTSDPIYLDFSRLAPESRTASGMPLVDYVFEVARQSHLLSIPTIGPLSRRGPGTAYFDAVSRVITRDKRGLAVRMPFEHCANISRLKMAIDETIDLVSVSLDQVDLFLDFGPLALAAVEAPLRPALRAILADALRVVERVRFRHVVFAASNLPDSLAPQRKNEVTRVARIEFQVWRDLVGHRNVADIGFGDYGVVHPLQSDGKVPRAPPSRVRIATEDEYFLYKGDPDGIRVLARRAIDDGRLQGVPDSWGSTTLRECARDCGIAGNATNWIARDTNVHIENTIALAGRHVSDRPSMASPLVTTGHRIQDSLLDL